MLLPRSGRSGGDESGSKFRGDRRLGTINGALSTPGYLLALLRELSHHVPRGLTENAATVGGDASTKNEPNRYFVPDQKNGPKIDPHVSNLRFYLLRFRGVQVHS